MRDEGKDAGRDRLQPYRAKGQLRSFSASLLSAKEEIPPIADRIKKGSDPLPIRHILTIRHPDARLALPSPGKTK